MATATDYTTIIGKTSGGQVDSRNGSGIVGKAIVITYSFETSAPLEDGLIDPSLNAAFLNSFAPLTAADQVVARQALQAWDAASGIQFVEVSGNLGEIRFGLFDFSQKSPPADPGEQGFAFTPNVDLRATAGSLSPVSGDVFIRNDVAANIKLEVYLHEIGHTLGLKHSFQGDPTLPSGTGPGLDNFGTTVMSYTGDATQVTGLGPLDVDAVRYLYGQNSQDGTGYSGGYTFDAATATFTIRGVAAADVIRGSSVADIIDGLGGTDALYGFQGNDILIGGAGSDTLIGGEGSDVFRPGAGNDFVEGGSGFSGDTSLGASVDLVDYSTAAAAITGKFMAGFFQDPAGNYTVRGADIGNDVLQHVASILLGSGSDSFEGDDAENLFMGNAGNDTLDGGNGNDTAVFAGARSAYTVTQSGGTVTVTSTAEGTDTLTNVELLRFGGLGGTSATVADAIANPNPPPNIVYANQVGDGDPNTLTGTAGPDALFGLGGNDTLLGGADTDQLLGGVGNDLLDGGLGNDVLYGQEGDDVLLGGAAAGSGTNYLLGGSGSDTASYAGTSATVYADLRSQGGVVGGVLTDLMDSVENLRGGTGNDVLVGNDAANVIEGGLGSDQIYGFGGDDILIGGAAASGSYNVLIGGLGSDTASFAGASADLYIDLRAPGAFVMSAGSYVLTDAMDSIENAIGGAGKDLVVGNDGANRLAGGGGADILYGFGGQDTFVFTTAADSAIATGYDVIVDFQTSLDKVDLRAFGIGAGNVLFATDASTTVLFADTDGATPGFELALCFVGQNAAGLGDILF